LTRPPVLVIEGLRVALPSDRGMVTVVDGVAYSVRAGEVFGIAGESGSGKTVSMLAALGLLSPRARTEGQVFFEGTDLLGMNRRALRQVRGRDIGLVMQDPTTSLHPFLTVQQQLTDHMRYHLHLTAAEANRRALGLLDDVRIPDPNSALKAFPHQLSGGMRQRVAIAIALACRPKLLIADEPTTALDVTVQAGILHLIDDLRLRLGLAVILITHDLGVMSAVADRLVVLYAGRVVEDGPASDLLQRPRHPYTAGLLAALPRSGTSSEIPLRAIPGLPVTIRSRPSGCAFHPRCQYAVSECAHMVPDLVEVSTDHSLACPVDPLNA
jgi:oligopeptide transport system ATP-binding protein